MTNPFPQTISNNPITLAGVETSMVTVLNQSINIMDLYQLLDTTIKQVPHEATCVFGIDKDTGNPTFTITWTTIQ